MELQEQELEFPVSFASQQEDAIRQGLKGKTYLICGSFTRFQNNFFIVEGDVGYKVLCRSILEIRKMCEVEYLPVHINGQAILTRNGNDSPLVAHIMRYKRYFGCMVSDCWQLIFLPTICIDATLFKPMLRGIKAGSLAGVG